VQDCEARRHDGLRERKKRATRRALHDATLRLVSERGLEHVTIEEISAAAGVSPRTFFNYFPNKDQAVLGDMVQVDPDRTMATIKSAATILDGLRELCLANAENTSPELEQVQMRWELMERYPALLPQMFSRFIEFENSVASAVAGRTGDQEDDAYPQLMASLAGTSMRVAVRRWTAGHGDHPLEYHVNEVFGLLRTELPTGSGQPTKGDKN
jgi:AcrR family transcriptional regulator